jgi:phenylacetate-CoA ligase
MPSTVTAAMYLGRSWWGIEPGDSSLNLWGHSKYLADSWAARVGLWRRRLQDAAMNRHVVPAYDLGESALRRFDTCWQRRRPRQIVGYASALYAAAEYILQQPASKARQRAQQALRGVISTGEMLYDWQAQTLEKAFGAPVIVEYGLCEGGAMLYGHPDGHLHVMDDLYWVELLDDEDQPVAPGEVGRIVFTTLRARDVPFVRYDTGDMGQLAQPCGDGSGRPRLSSIQGRAYDFILNADGEARPGVLFTHAMKYVSSIDEYQIQQHKAGSLIVNYTASSIPDPAELAEAERKMQEQAGAIEVSFEHVAELPREASGKYRWIRSFVEPAAS